MIVSTKSGGISSSKSSLKKVWKVVTMGISLFFAIFNAYFPVKIGQCACTISKGMEEIIFLVSGGKTVMP